MRRLHRNRSKAPYSAGRCGRGDWRPLGMGRLVGPVSNLKFPISGICPGAWPRLARVPRRPIRNCLEPICRTIGLWAWPVAACWIRRTRVVFLVHPDCRQVAGEPGDGQFGGDSTLGDRFDDARGEIGERRQGPNMSLRQVLPLGDHSDVRCRVFDHCIDPCPRPRDHRQQRRPRGFVDRPAPRGRMRDSLAQRKGRREGDREGTLFGLSAASGKSPDRRCDRNLVSTHDRSSEMALK
jgi:hypothetical protein